MSKTPYQKRKPGQTGGAAGRGQTRRGTSGGSGKVPPPPPPPTPVKAAQQQFLEIFGALRGPEPAWVLPAVDKNAARTPPALDGK